MKKLFNEFKRLFCLLIIIGQLTLLVGCPNSVKEIKPQGMMYFSFFDTVSTIYSYAGDDAEDFKKNCDEVSAILEEYHKLFDIYNEYSGINNLCTLNKPPTLKLCMLLFGVKIVGKTGEYAVN